MIKTYLSKDPEEENLTNKQPDPMGEDYSFLADEVIMSKDWALNHKYAKTISDISHYARNPQTTADVEPPKEPSLKDFIWSNEVSGVFYVRKIMTGLIPSGFEGFIPQSESNMLTIDAMVDVANQMTDPNWLYVLDYQAARLEEIAEVMKTMAIAVRFIAKEESPQDPNAEEGVFSNASYMYTYQKPTLNVPKAKIYGDPSAVWVNGPPQISIQTPAPNYAPSFMNSEIIANDERLREEMNKVHLGLRGFLDDIKRSFGLPADDLIDDRDEK